MRRRSDGAEVGGKCSCLLLVLLFNLTLGGCLFDYALYSVVGKDVPWFADAVAGLFLGQFALPAAVICWIVRLCGVDVPFVG